MSTVSPSSYVPSQYGQASRSIPVYSRVGAVVPTTGTSSSPVDFLTLRVDHAGRLPGA